MRDASDEFLQAIASARETGQQLSIVGTGSKSGLTGNPSSWEGRLLSTVEHTGIVDYRPDELVVTVRSGTRLKALKQALAREGQMLGFEPPEFRGLGTVGGAVAAGIAGPGRAWRGGARDAVLGVQMINGLAERLSFGGQVMKNVAGFDVSRLQAGAFGMLGLLLELSLKVLPLPQAEQTLCLELPAEDAHGRMLDWVREPHPITATAWLDGVLWVRLSGAEAAVSQAVSAFGGEVQPDNAFWPSLRDHRLPFFRTDAIACRHLPPANALAQRRIKAAFDPDNLFNPELTDADLAA
jgi:glycolate oxidase FAD binding subunit